MIYATLLLLSVFSSGALSATFLKGKGSEVVVEKEKIILKKGRILVFKAQADKQVENVGHITFTGRRADFEVTVTDSVVDLDVYSGEVEVSSHHVQTFVPEIVKGKQGFQYNKLKPAFSRRKFDPKMKKEWAKNKDS